ncbi:NACHT domain-containing protein [Algihabitans sp.]|uniref:NACHT domain-containing protein n=1 Tax=Algihabitans sp. TaxID=2821514 RepID=UPI003BA8EB65
MKSAPLDRRVAVQTNAEPVVQPLSHLREEPYIVLLGEPGAGKSTTLLYEAVAEDGEVMTCREVMNGTPLSNSGTAYLDALDEFRSGDNGKDKLLQLANAISASDIRRWRLTCRVEDWRDAADSNAMRRAANNEPIIVAHLLPLDEEEAQAILGALEEPDPKSFVQEAHDRGASAFLENPLSLRLLHSAVVSNGVWPTTRFELFDRAIWALAHEHDRERATDPRPSIEEIIGATSAMCFYFLASGARALWRSNTLPPDATDTEYVPIHGLGLESRVAAASLDTPLFRGEGHAFQPFHRTVAEFLAARFLAARVVGAANSPAFPLRRATALVAGKDRKAPSELRGLYAWFAAHLQKKGDPEGARRLIERDAATVLAYGDAAAFDTAGRKEILNNLDQEDPYFLTSQNDATVFGGLAGDDLADDFIAILDADVRSHLQVTILQALADAPPIERMSDKLREIALTNSRPLWMRERAAEVFLRKATNQNSARHALFEDLGATASDRSQLAIRARILAGTPTDDIQPEELRQLLLDFDASPPRSRDEKDIDETGSLVSLTIALRRSPRAEFFDEAIERDGNQRRHHWQVQSLLTQALASAIDDNPDITAERLWTWLSNVREHPWDMFDSDVVEAIQRWIDRDTDRRELELFFMLINNSPAEKGPWVVSNHYISTTRRLPSEAVIKGLIDLAKTKKKGRERKRLFQVAAYAARSETRWPKWRDPIISQLEQEGGFKGFIKSLLADPNSRWKKKEAKRKAEQDRETEKSRRENVAELTPKLIAIATGTPSEFGILSTAAEHYRNARIAKNRSPLENVTKYTNEEIAGAIAEGFVQFAIHTDIKVGIEELGRAAAKNSAYRQEHVVGAGLHQALLHRRENDLSACPLVIALVGLRQSYFSGDEEPSIAAWAVGRLARDADQGADLILRYWNAALDAGDDGLDAIHHLTSAGEPELVSKCLTALLETRPNLPEQALRQALSACSANLGSSELVDLVRRTFDRDDLEKKQREMWNFVGLALMPAVFSDQLSEAEQEAALLAPYGDLAKTFNRLCPELDLLDRMRIGVLGKKYPANDYDWRHSNSVSGIVRTAIRRLSASKATDAGEHLKALAPQVHASWQPQIAHSAAEHARKVRDEQFTAPSVSQLLNALEDGPPASPTDLAAIVCEEVERYKRTLRTGSEMPWKRFWNTDSYGAATNPQIENEDRDRLLELFRPRFERYGIAASLPEARRGENTRADILLLSHAGKNLPIEAKRHYNDELWTALVNQLAGYALDEHACGFGTYLVFWFGAEFKTPARDDGVEAPDSAEALATMLTDDLPSHLKDKLTVVVLDVSRPRSMIAATEERCKKSCN